MVTYARRNAGAAVAHSARCVGLKCGPAQSERCCTPLKGNLLLGCVINFISLACEFEPNIMKMIVHPARKWTSREVENVDGVQGVSWGSKGCPWEPLGTHQSPWDPIEPHGVPIGPMGSAHGLASMA